MSSQDDQFLIASWRKFHRCLPSQAHFGAYCYLNASNFSPSKSSFTKYYLTTLSRPLHNVNVLTPWHRMQIEDILTEHSPEKIIETLGIFLTEERVRRIQQVLVKRVKGVQVALEAPADIHNALAVTRTGEALGVHQFHLIDAQLVKGQGKSTMRGSARWIHLHRHDTIEEFHSKMEGFVLAGASLEGDLTLEELPKNRPLCLVFGNEQKGLTPKAKKMCDLLYRIPMVGMVESFNLSVSAGLSLYQVMRDRHVGDLNWKEQIDEKARYYVKSIGIKVAHDILQRSRE